MSTQPSTEHEYRQGPSLGTVIWGAVVVALAALIVAGRLGWFAVDPGMVAVVLLLVGGLGLVVGAGAAARGRRGPAGVRSPEERAEP